jgi:hypothetical protein
VRAEDVDAGEEFLEVCLDDVFKEHECALVAGQVPRKRDEAP